MPSNQFNQRYIAIFLKIYIYLEIVPPNDILYVEIVNFQSYLLVPALKNHIFGTHKIEN